MRKSPIIAALIGASILLPLAGCTNGSSDAGKTPAPSSPSSAAPGGSSKAPAPSGSTSASDTKEAKDIANKCVDGFASIIGDGKDISLPDGCDTVSVVTNGSTVTIGPVKQLLVESTKTTIHVTGAKELHAFGNDNKVAYKGAKPTIDDKGTGNSFTAE